MALERPIFIIGTGRCGSTIFQDVLARHPRVAYLSRLCQTRPDRPALNRKVMERLDWPGLGELVRRKCPPGEPWDFWDRYVRGFSAPFRDLTADDVRPNEKRRLRQVLEGMTTARRDRLLVKLTGWPRTGFVREIFLDAVFIHVYRDGRAVANSLLNVDFWKGWGGPEAWQWGPLGAADQEAWDRHGRSFVALAAIQWKVLMESYERAKPLVPVAQYLDVKYEDFAADPLEKFAEVLRFCGLDYPPAFRAAVASQRIESANYKWKEDLTPAQRQILDDCLANTLERFGYKV